MFIYTMQCHHCEEILWSINPLFLLAMMEEHLEIEFQENTKKNFVV